MIPRNQDSVDLSSSVSDFSSSTDSSACSPAGSSTAGLSSPEVSVSASSATSSD
jgi:hypothetical protein